MMLSVALNICRERQHLLSNRKHDLIPPGEVILLEGQVLSV